MRIAFFVTFWEQFGIEGEGPGEGQELGGDGVGFLNKKMYLVGSTSIGQKSGPPVNRVFWWSNSRITTFWAQIWNRSDPFYILRFVVGSFFENANIRNFV